MSDMWDDEPGLQRRKPRRSPWPARIALGAGLAAFIGLVAWGALSLVSDSGPAKRRVVNITLVAPPPPPPPPPPPEVKPPEPEVQEEVKVPEPEAPQAEEAPPIGDQLGLDADASGSGDGFGLAAKKGGTDITRLGGPPGGDRAQYTWFTALVQSHLQGYLHENSGLRKADYRVVLRVWFGRDGRVERYELASSSGNPDVDRNLRLAMDAIPPMRQLPPADLPQPIKLRVTSRGAG